MSARKTRAASRAALRSSPVRAASRCALTLGLGPLDTFRAVGDASQHGGCRSAYGAALVCKGADQRGYDRGLHEMPERGCCVHAFDLAVGRRQPLEGEASREVVTEEPR